MLVAKVMCLGRDGYSTVPLFSLACWLQWKVKGQGIIKVSESASNSGILLFHTFLSPEVIYISAITVLEKC